MLPSVNSGHLGIASKPVYGSDIVQEIGIVNRSPLEDDADRSVPCPSLPLISEGSFASLLSKTSSGPLEGSNLKGRRDGKVISPRGDSDTHSYHGLKQRQLQLNCELKKADRGWFPHGLNPRLANSSCTQPHLPKIGVHMLSMSEQLMLHRSLGESLRILQKRREKSSNDRNGYLMTLGGPTILNNRYEMTAATSLVRPTVQKQTRSSNAPESTSSVRNGAGKHASVAIHSKCCCQRHIHSNEHKGTSKSRLSGILPTKERPCRGKSKGYLFKQRSHGNALGNEKIVKPSDRPPPNMSLASNGISVTQSKKKNRRTVYMLSSNSSLSLHREQKSEQKLTPDNTRQKFLDSPEPKMERSLPSVRVSIGQSEEKAKVMVCQLEKVVESHHQDTKEKTIEMMDVEHNEDEKEIDDNREQPDTSDVKSLVRYSAAGNCQRSATPRLLKVTSEVPVDSALARRFRKLDTDCDGHISFPELKKSLPQHLTRHQINYLKKIYDLACESTFFGLEEFVAVHEMCDVLIRSSPTVSNSLSNIDSLDVDLWINTFMKSFREADKNQSGVIDIQSFETLLATVQPNSFIVQDILGDLGKSADDTISGVELLAYIPYLVAAPSKAT